MAAFLGNNSIIDLVISFNESGWGPVSGERLLAFDSVPYAHFDKKDKLGRPADFSQGSHQYQRSYQRFNRRDDPSSQNADFSYKHDAVEDSSFQLVDTSKTQSKTSKRGWAQQTRGGQQNMGGRFGPGGRGVGGRGAMGAKPDMQEPYVARGRNSRIAPGQQGGRGGGRMGAGGRGNMRRFDRKPDRLASLTVGGDWEVVEEFDLSQLLKLVANPPQADDLVWCGHVDQYDDSFDKVTCRSSKPLKRLENKLFYSVTSQEDPVLQRLCSENVGDVYATDAILAHLMAAPRSVYSWDIIIEKTDGKIFLDTREDSAFDLLTVSETANDPPTASEEMEERNHPEKLSNEATAVNQNFTQQILMETPEARKSFEPNPFLLEDVEGEPASVVYRYRKFTLGNIKLVARCELHGWTQKNGQEQFFTSAALNEWDSKHSGGVIWRQKLDQQRGAVLATELKNNSCKLAKWTAQALLSGADQMKIGYVSRVAPTNPYEHVVLTTQVFKPKEFALQINLQLKNMWGIIKMVCELLMQKEDGKYVLLKDPNKAVIRLYSVPLETFEKDDADEAGDSSAARQNA